MANDELLPEDQPEDDGIPDWERLDPDDWLKPPYFAKDVDIWLREVQAIIKDGRTKKRLPERAIASHDLLELSRIVAGYIKTRVDWEGWLSATDRTELERVQAQTRRLLDVLCDQENAARRPVWYVDHVLREKSVGWSLAELKHVLEILSKLEGIEQSSPRLDTESTARSHWPSPTEANARALLQGEIEAWWKRTAELSTAAAKEKSLPFHAFLEATFGPIPMSDAPSSSETAIKKARREFMALKERKAGAKKRLREALARLKTKGTS